MAPAVDHRRASAGALADEVHLVVAERPARGLEVVHSLRQRVAREVDSLVLESLPTFPVRIRLLPERVLREEVGRVPHGVRDLGAVEDGGAVDAAVAHEDHVALVGEAARLREVHVREAGTALEPEDRARADALSGRGCG